MKALSNNQVTQLGWYYLEPEVLSIGNYPRFYLVEDENDVHWINRGRPKNIVGKWYGPLSIEQITAPEGPEVLTPYQPLSAEQRSVKVYFNDSKQEYSCYPAQDELPRTISVATLDAPTWIADTLNKLHKLLPPPLK